MLPSNFTICGKPPHTKFLIVHADDLGMAHAVNQAAFAAFEAGAITSASAMVPCPCFPEVVDSFKTQGALDLGIHLTITSEWPHYRWAGISPREHIHGLLDPSGYLWPDSKLIRATPTQVATEMRAQIRRAIQCGLDPTHIDTHMFSAFSKPEFAIIYAEVASEFRLPCLVPTSREDLHPFLPGLSGLQDQNVVRVNLLFASAHARHHLWLDHYLDLLACLRPGLNQLIVHPGLDTAEMRAITAGQEPWGAAWRQRDFDVLMSKEFKSACRKSDIHLINWRETMQMTSPTKTIDSPEA